MSLSKIKHICHVWLSVALRAVGGEVQRKGKEVKRRDEGTTCDHHHVQHCPSSVDLFLLLHIQSKLLEGSLWLH
ncbi:hypothetical protein JOB18_035983 [Solea senegalensis]|uniref:Secreted protein n=1 Tax=Solea senegalensis TaxID=28829 RepID=A0AAV6PYU3_SOLSE|nr:hypothetical protein JOB18_035983 [Solea senegalensis]